MGRAFVGRLAAARDGWQLRPYQPEDDALLRPDLAHCSTKPRAIDGDTFLNRGQSNLARCPLIRQAADFWVYAKGKQRIAVLLHYHRPQTVGAFICMPRMPVASLVLDTFGADHAQRRYNIVTSRGGWRYGALPSTERRPGAAITRMPLRLRAQKQGDGTLTAFVIANTPRSDVFHVLDGLHHPLLDAMVAKR